MKVHVDYEKLDSTSSRLDDIDQEFKALIDDMENEKTEINADGSNHDDCYKDAETVLDRIIANFKKHQQALQFIQQQCKAAVAAFTETEDGNIDMANENAINYVTQICKNFYGYTDEELKDLKLEDYAKKKNLDDAIDEATKATGADISKVWNNIFKYDKDKDDILTEAGTAVAKYAESIIPVEPGEEEPAESSEPKSEPKSNPPTSQQGQGNDPTPGTPSSNGPGGSTDGGGGGGGNSTSVTPIKPIEPIEPAKPEDSDSDKVEDTIEAAQNADQTAQAEQNANQSEAQAAQNADQTAQTTAQTAQTPPQPYVEDNTYEEQYPHTGGGYSANDGYYSYEGEENGITEDLSGLEVEGEVEENPDLVEDILDDSSEGVNIISGGKKYTKIPSSTTPITTTTSKSKGNGIIPIAAGISAAAAAGIGAKAYLDRKNNNENGEDSDEFDSDEWDENSDNVEIDYSDSSNGQEYLEEDDNFEYQAIEDEKYGARNNEELADLQ